MLVGFYPKKKKKKKEYVGGEIVGMGIIVNYRMMSGSSLTEYRYFRLLRMHEEHSTAVWVVANTQKISQSSSG